MGSNEPAHFYPNACAVCLDIGNKDGNVLRVCEKCRMISYCTDEHQREHWERHRELCEAIQRTHRSQNRVPRDHLLSLTTEGWVQKQRNFMLTLMQKLGRHLTTYEQEMCTYAIKCQLTCSSDYNFVNCSRCASVSYCTRHDYGMAEHRNSSCALLKQCFTTDVFNNKCIEINYMMHIYNKHSFDDMLSFINRFVKCMLKGINTLTVSDTIAFHSEYFTRPLTVLHGLVLIAKKRMQIGPRDEYIGSVYREQPMIHTIPICGPVEKKREMVKCNLYKRIPEDKEAVRALQLVDSPHFVIHVIAADSEEIETRQTWEVLFHFIDILRTITVIMIGPKLNQETGNNIIKQKMCPSCVNKKLMFECHGIFYEDYVRSPLYKKPNLTVAFNPKIKNYTCGFLQSEHLWTGSIKALPKQDCPFIMTALSHDHATEEFNCIMRVLNISGRFPNINIDNPYASLRPRRQPDNNKFNYINSKLLIYTTFEKKPTEKKPNNKKPNDKKPTD